MTVNVEANSLSKLVEVQRITDMTSNRENMHMMAAVKVIQRKLPVAVKTRYVRHNKNSKFGTMMLSERRTD